MYPSSITTEKIALHQQEHPSDRYCIRRVNGEHGQHWAVCDQATWGILSLSYTKREAEAILSRFNKRHGGRR